MDELSGRIGIVSDAHGNVAALAKAVRLLRLRGAARIFCLGDAVGYLPGAGGLDWLDAEGIPSLKGNHEAMLAGERPFAPGHDGIYRLLELRAALAETRLAGLRRLPTEFTFASAAGRVLMVHASPDDPLHGYVYPDTPLAGIRRQDFDLVFMGHTHRPFIRSWEGRRFVNVGSCGQPRDHGGYGAACLFDADRGEVDILRFDIRSETRAAIAAAGLGRTYLADVLLRRPAADLMGSIHDD